MSWAGLGRLAQQRLAAGDGLEFEAWRSVMTTFRSVAGDDPAVGQVVDLAAGAARVQGSSRIRGSDPLLRLAEQTAASGPGPGMQDAALQITHLALRSVVRVEEERVLATAELELTPGREVSDLAATLQGWRRTLAVSGAAGLTSSEMAAVAVNQVKLLKVTRTWCTQVSSPEGLRLGEVSGAVEDAYAAWASAVREWSPLLPRTAEVSAAQATLNRSWVAVLQAIRTEPSAARRVEALIASGMGGVLAAGLAVRAPGDTSSVLTAAGVAMELALDSWHSIHLRDVAAQKPAVQHNRAAAPPTPPRVSTVLAPQTAEPQRGGVDVSKEELPPNRWESHREAARAMVAGTIAKAALAGDVTARQITAGVHGRDLDGLVERGERAKAALLVWAQPILVNALQGRFSKLTGPGRDELLQTMTVQLAETVHRWDPDKARFTTFVYRLAQFGPDRQARRFEERSRSEQPMGEQAESWQAETKTVEEQVLDAVSLTEIRRRIERLPAEQRDVLQRRFGLAGKPPITRRELAAERGVSPSTIRRVEDQALHALRDTTGQEVTRAVTSRSLSEQLTVAAASLHTKLTIRLRTNREASTQRPLIDRIQELASAKQESRLSQWMKQPARERDGLER